MEYKILPIFFVTFVSPTIQRHVDLANWNDIYNQYSLVDQIPRNQRVNLNNRFDSMQFFFQDNRFTPNYQFIPNTQFSRNNQEVQNPFQSSPTFLSSLPSNSFNQLPWNYQQRDPSKTFQTLTRRTTNTHSLNQSPLTTHSVSGVSSGFNNAISTPSTEASNSKAFLDALVTLLASQKEQSSRNVGDKNFQGTSGMQQTQFARQLVGKDLQSPNQQQSSFLMNQLPLTPLDQSQSPATGTAGRQPQQSHTSTPQQPSSQDSLLNDLIRILKKNYNAPNIPAQKISGTSQSNARPNTPSLVSDPPSKSFTNSPPVSNTIASQGRSAVPSSASNPLNSAFSSSGSNSDAATLIVVLHNLLRTSSTVVPTTAPKKQLSNPADKTGSTKPALQYAMKPEILWNARSIDNQLKDIAIATLPYGSMNTAVIQGGPMYIPDLESFRVEYDMILSMEEMEQRIRPDQRKKRALLRGEMNLWPSAVIPYSLDNSFTTGEKQKVHKALRQWESYTCVKFRKSTTADAYSIKIQDSDGCHSFVGTKRQKDQVVGLARPCRKTNIILHEIGHVIGMYHEQSRYDRNQYLQIQYQNILPQTLYNFAALTRQTSDDYGVPYDYESIMHYGENAFSFNEHFITMKTIDPKYQKIIGKATRLSFRDIMAVNFMYKCAASCQAPPECPAESFLGKDCKCWCATPRGHPEPAEHCKGVFTPTVPSTVSTEAPTLMPQERSQTVRHSVSLSTPPVGPTSVPVAPPMAPQNSNPTAPRSVVSAAEALPFKGERHVISTSKLASSNPNSVIGIPLGGNSGKPIMDNKLLPNTKSLSIVSSLRARETPHKERLLDMTANTLEDRWLSKPKTSAFRGKVPEVSLGNTGPAEVTKSSVKVQQPVKQQVANRKKETFRTSSTDAIYGSSLSNLPRRPRPQPVSRSIQRSRSSSNIRKLLDIQGLFAKRFGNGKQTDPLVQFLYPLVTAALRMRIAQEQALAKQSALQRL